MSRPYRLKGQPQRADPAYLERLAALQEARKNRPHVEPRHSYNPAARHASYIKRRDYDRRRAARRAP